MQRKLAVFHFSSKNTYLWKLYKIILFLLFAHIIHKTQTQKSVSTKLRNGYLVYTEDCLLSSSSTFFLEYYFIIFLITELCSFSYINKHRI